MPHFADPDRPPIPRLGWVLSLFACIALSGCAGSPTPSAEESGDPAALPPTPTALPQNGLSPSAAARLRAVLNASGPRVDGQRMDAVLRGLTKEPRDAGSLGARRSAEFVRQRLLLAGFEVRTDTYEVELPTPVDVTVELLAPYAYRCSLSEPPLREDFDTHTARGLPPHVAFSPDGEVLGPLIYVNRGRDEDFRHLEQAGVSVLDAIGIARTGLDFPGDALRRASERGLSALIFFPDPKDLGWSRGEVYPAGPWLPAGGALRLSGLDLQHYPGDPGTPGSPAFADQRTVSIDRQASRPVIIAASISAEAAAPLLQSLDGAAVPAGWQGSLPFTYHLGGTSRTTARVRVASDAEPRAITNVVASIRGLIHPDEWVILGARRDGAVHGAAEGASSTAVLLEVAQVLGSHVQEGWRPGRSIMLCSFDGTGVGLLGSTEHVERELVEGQGRSIVAYINLDTAITGDDLLAAGSPELTSTLQAALTAATDTSERSIPPTGLWLPGGDRDTSPFLHHLGVPVLDLSLRGPNGVVGSVYDTFRSLITFGDPGLSRHQRLVRIVNAFILHLTTATLLPYDFETTAGWIRQEAEALLDSPERTAFLEAAMAWEAAAQAWAQARDAFLATDPDPLALRRTNRALADHVRSFAAAPGADGSPFYRHRLLAPSPDDLRQGQSLPEIRRALAQGRPEDAAAALTDLTARVRSATAQLAALTGSLGPR